MVGLITRIVAKYCLMDEIWLGKKTRQKLIRKDIGMLFQGSALFDSLTVEENIMFPLNMFAEKLSESEKLDRVNHCLERVPVPDVNQLYH